MTTYVSRFEPDETRFAEFLACLWQGEIPVSLTLHRWLYLRSVPRAMLLFWEGDEAAKAYVDRSFGGFGALKSDVVTEDATPGLAACFRRDLEAFEDWLVSREEPQAVQRQLDVRRRGLQASSQEQAAAAGRAWAAEHTQR